MATYLFFLILLINLGVGIPLGMSGIAGFLLPLLYVGFLQLPLRDSLALSFFSFAVAGIIGAYSYWKSKNMDLRLALFISIGSIPGALFGVQLNVLIPEHIAELILYIFIFLSGLSLLLKKDTSSLNLQRSVLLENKILILIIGLLTAAICSLTGAGGPILLVPLLTLLGLQIRIAVGVSLLNSVVIALPAMFGYFQYSSMENLTLLIVASLIGQIIGINIGAYFSNKISTNHLRIFITWITLISSMYMITRLFM
ncbi:sulfite exporter TauE/SafE family protein [Salicibibacter cibi]|uniref:Probable membrane transporter protein n=1 Tax=Salicibibacter cibi TaxID=2743001 RepID=A0A7T6ZCM4_9BACI|nr:sulfite exporter TauE/SafE family protein [Salicibibacter cibi]QQK81039.1 sulfite exporter TauE/SafE family protein [Salicibibacter cibi]